MLQFGAFEYVLIASAGTYIFNVVRYPPNTLLFSKVGGVVLLHITFSGVVCGRALLLIYVVFEISIVVRFVQSSNIPLLIRLGIMILLNELQPENTPVPIDVDFDISILVRLEQPEKALFAMV